MPAWLATISASSCHRPPVPEVEIEILPGLALAALTTSSKVLNGESGLTDQLPKELPPWKYCQSTHGFDVACPMTRTNLL